VSGTGEANVLVASDLRASSPQLKEQVMAALVTEGLEPVDCGCVPTPALASAAIRKGVPAVMVTGSHIAADRNGLKFYLASGEISKPDEMDITVLAQGMDSVPAGAALRVAASFTDIAQDFLDRYSRFLPMNGLQGLRIGVYEHSTVARDMLSLLLRNNGADVVALGRCSDFLAVDTEAVGTETERSLRLWAEQYDLDAIVSADGDGDRPMVADENGILLRGEMLGIVTAQFLGADIVVTPVTSNSGTERNLSCPVIRTRVGSPYVIAGMDEARQAGCTSVFGFEANGGVLTGTDMRLGDFILPALPTRDAFLPILCVLGSLARERGRLSQMVSQLTLQSAIAGKLENLPGNVTEFFRQGQAGHQRLAGLVGAVCEVASVDLTDGWRATLADGSVVHLRMSGNEPALRCYIEAATEAGAQALLRRVGDLITKDLAGMT
jgi:phosphomannomutase